MAAENLYPVASGTTPSDPFDVANGERVGLLFRPGPGTKSTDRIALLVKNSDDGWDPVASFGPGENTGTLTMAGTYRFQRGDGVNAGMDRTTAAP